MGTNAGIINLTGGTYDNNGHPLNNTGQISGWGILATGEAGLDNNGSVTFSGGPTTVYGPVTNENGRMITINAFTPTVFTGLVTNNMGGTFNTVNTDATFAGGFTNNGNSNFAKAGNGVVEIPIAPTLNSGSSLSVTTGTLRFNLISGTPTIGTGVTAVVSAGATLELAGSVSALANGANRVNVINNSNAPGILVSGMNQQVGFIDGTGTTQVTAGSDLSTNHIIQNALIIGGTAGGTATVTIASSDASGNPLGQVDVVSTQMDTVPASALSADGSNSWILMAPGADSVTGDLIPAGGGTPTSGSAPVPEPSTLALACIALAASISLSHRLRSKPTADNAHLIRHVDEVGFAAQRPSVKSTAGSDGRVADLGRVDLELKETLAMRRLLNANRSQACDREVVVIWNSGASRTFPSSLRNARLQQIDLNATSRWMARATD